MGLIKAWSELCVSEKKKNAGNEKSKFWADVRWFTSLLVLVLFIRTFVGEATVVPSGSMERTILVGDHVFLNKLVYGPPVPFTRVRLPGLRDVWRLDIVAFRFPPDPSQMFVKRVIGLPGEVVQVRSGVVFINGRKLEEPYLVRENHRQRDNFGPVAVPLDHYFMLGDNRDNSADSRVWGFVPHENIVGKPSLVYWSYEAPTESWISPDWRVRAEFYASLLVHFYSRTRWDRTGQTF